MLPRYSIQRTCSPIIKTVSLLLFLTVFSCHKDKDKDKPEQKGSIEFSIEAPSVQPAQLVTITADKPLEIASGTGSLGGKPVQLVQVDPSHYIFYAPPLAPGDYPLELKELGAANTPTVTIGNYEAITDPQGVIKQISGQYHDLVDELKAGDEAKVISENDLLFMHQLMNQVTGLVKTSTPEDVLSIAYQLRLMNSALHATQPATSKVVSIVQARPVSMRIPSVIRSLTSATNQPTAASADPGDELLQQLISADFTNEAVNTAFKVTLAAYAVAAIFPNTAPSAIICTGVSCYLKAKITLANNRIARSAGIASGIDNGGRGETASPVILSSDQSVFQRLKGIFRTIRKAEDKHMPEAFPQFINLNEQLAETDGTIKTIFEALKAKLSNLFSSLTATYTAYTSPILETPAEKSIDLRTYYGNLRVSEISNPDITLQAAGDGANGFKITATNPKGNIKSTTEFTYKLTYLQAALNHETAVLQHAVFKPVEEEEPEPTNTELLTGNWLIKKSDFIVEGALISQAGGPNDVFNLLANGQFSGRIGTETTGGTWTINDKNVLTIGHFTNTDILEPELQMKVLTLTARTLSVFIAGRPGVGYDNLTIYLEKP